MLKIKEYVQKAQVNHSAYYEVMTMNQICKILYATNSLINRTATNSPAMDMNQNH